MAVDRFFIAASDSFMSTSVAATSIAITDASMFVSGNSAKYTARAWDQATNVFAPTREFVASTLQPENPTKYTNSVVSWYVANPNPNLLLSPSLDAFMYIKGKSEVGLQTELEGAFNTKEGMFFWG